MKKHIILTIFALITILLATACSSSSNKGGFSPELASSTLAGQVLNAQGVPVPNAEVWLYQSKTAYKTALAQQSTLANSLHTMRMSAANPELRTNTNQNGEYTFTNVPNGEYTLLAMAGNSLQFVQTGVIADGTRGSATAVVATLTPTGNASGTLMLNSKPVKGAVVYLENTNYLAITDLNGHFSFTNVPVETYNLKLLETPLLTDINYVITLSQPKNLTIEAATTTDVATINISTRNNNEYPYLIKGAFNPNFSTDSLDSIVVLAINTGSSSAPSIRGASIPAPEEAEITYGCSDAEGNYQILAKELGYYFIVPLNLAEDLTVEPLFYNVEITESNTQSNPKVVDDFTLAQDYLLSGVLKNSSGSPIAFATLIFYSEDTNYSKTVKTDVNGEYKIYLPAGSYKLACDGYTFEADLNPPFSKANYSQILESIATPVSTTNTSVVSGNVYRTNSDDPMSDVTIELYNLTTEEKYYTQTNQEGYYTITLPYGNYEYSLLEPHEFDLPPFVQSISIDALSVTMPRINAIEIIPTPLSYQILNINYSSEQVRGVEVIGEYLYVIHQENNQEIKIYRHLDDDGDNIPLSTTILRSEDIVSVSTLVHNNTLYVLVTEAERTFLYSFDQELNGGSVVIDLESSDYEIFSDGLSLLAIKTLILDGSGNLTAEWSEVGSSLVDIDTNTPLQHFTPCADDEYFYYPKMGVPTDAGETILIVKRNKSDTQETIMTTDLLSEFSPSVSYENLKSCQLSCDASNLYVTLQTYENYEETFYRIIIIKSTGEIDSASGATIDSLKFLEYFPVPGEYSFLAYPNHFNNYLTVPLANNAIKIVNPYRVASDRTYLIGKALGKLKVVAIYSEAGWVDFLDYVPPAH